MSTNNQTKTNQPNPPLTRVDVERLLAEAGSPEKLDLSGQNLFNADLSHLNLSKANLREADLNKANLSKANLREADLIRANLHDAYLLETDLSKADLSKANLSNAELHEADLSFADLSFADLSYAHFRQADLIGAYLRDANLSRADLSKANVSKAYLSGADLSGADLSGADLRNTNLSTANLGNTDLSYTNLGNTDLSYANLDKANLCGADLRNANLSNANLKNTRLVQVKLNEANLVEAQLANKNGIGPELVDVFWGDINLNVVKWSQIKILGDEQAAKQKKQVNYNGESEKKDRKTREYNYDHASRAYRQLSVALKEQGLTEANEFAFRAQLMQRNSLWFAFTRKDVKLFTRISLLGKFLFSWFLFLIAGYGYRISHAFASYAAIVTIFALIYLSSTSANLLEAIVASINALHGRAVTSNISTAIGQNDGLLLATGFEAVIGLIVEITFIAAITQRFFNK